MLLQIQIETEETLRNIEELQELSKILLKIKTIASQEILIIIFQEFLKELA